MKSINNTYQIIALTMAFIMFATTVNLAIDMHFCQGELKSISLFGKAETCHEKAAATMPNCPHHKKMMEKPEGCSMQKKGCCDSKLLLIQADLDEAQVTSDFINNQKLQHFVAAFIEAFLQNNLVEKAAPNFQIYHPPKIIKDIAVLHQSFLL